MIEIQNYHDRVRTLLWGNISVENDVIDMHEYKNMAERFVIEYVPDYEELNVDDTMLFESCIIYQTAILLFPYAQQNTLKIEQSPQVKSERFQPDLEKILNDLIAKRDKILSYLSPKYEEESKLEPYGFLLTDVYNNPNSLL